MISKERNYGIDLLRIVAMLMVVILHILGRGGILNAVHAFSPPYCLGWFLEIACFGAVNCYALISGYVGYGRKTRYANLVYILFCALFYLLFLTAAGYLATPCGGTETIKNSLLHIRVIDGWWYVKAYFAAFLLFPLANFIVKTYDKKKLYSMLAVAFVVFSVIPTMACSDIFLVRGGYSPWWLLLLYFAGAVIKKYDIGAHGRKIKYFSLYVLAILLVFLAKIGIDYISFNYFDIKIFGEYLITYVSPLIVLSSVFLLMTFRNITGNKLVNKMISFLSPLTFGVYLIHTQYYAWAYLENRFAAYANRGPALFVFSVISTAAVLYLVCSILDYIRQCIFSCFKIRKVCDLADAFMRKEEE